VFSPDQILDDLRGEYRGRLHFDTPTRSLYASDASPFHIMPAGVAVPEDEADLQVLVKYAYSRGLPIIPRGAGTGLAASSPTTHPVATPLSMATPATISPACERFGTMANSHSWIGVTYA